VKKLFSPQIRLLIFLKNLLSLQILFALIFATVADAVDLEEYENYVNRSPRSIGSEINNNSLLSRKLFGMPSVPKTVVRKTKRWIGVLLKEGELVNNLDEIKIKLPSSSEIPTLEIVGVFPHSSAANVGLLVGDKILAVDDELISQTTRYNLVRQFNQQIANSPIGKNICLHILRNQKMRKFFVPVLPWPRMEAEQKSHPALEKDRGKNSESFLYRVLNKRNLLDEYYRTAAEISDRGADVTGNSLDRKIYNPFRLREVNYLLNNPTDLPLVSENLVSSLGKQFSQRYVNFVGIINEAMDGLDFEKFKDKPEQGSNIVLSLYQNFSNTGFNEVSKKELEQLFELALKINLPKLMQASISVAKVLDKNLIKLPKSLLEFEFPANWNVVNEDNLIRIQTPKGKIFIGGEGNNIYREDALLIIDLGGDDIYLNNAGGSTEKFPYSVLIDFSGTDLYMSSKNVSQGSGFLGGGFLVDYAGNDRYISNMYSQGSGFLGVGLLADLGGQDEYSCEEYCQASGIFGIGLLAEANGNDKYFADIFSQGVGLPKGYGALIEAGGDDDYFAGGVYPDHRQPEKAFKSMSQGFGYGIRPSGIKAGSSGGIGIIADQKGDDTYIGDYFGQGSSYWYALGVLSDKEGNDKYIAGRYSQGAGIHFSAGILSDSNGDDEYFVDYGVSQGCGHDLAIGILLDNGGDDKYTGGIISQGAGNGNGIGVFNDNGGMDEYRIKEPGQGTGHYLPFRNLGSIGVFIDTGGDVDRYHNGDKNNRMIFKNHWGIFADIK
jgi:hypothetical protein